MAKPKKETVPLFKIKHDYDESLKAYCEAASMLHVSVVTALHLASQGTDPARCLETIRKYNDAFEAAAHGI